MKLAPIIKLLRLKCPSFERRVFGLYGWSRVDETTNATMPCAYVLPASVKGGEVAPSTAYRQGITDSFDIAVAVHLSPDDWQGKAGHDYVEELKAEIFRAILGLKLDAGVILRFESQVVSLNASNRNRLVELLTFSFDDDLDADDSVQGADYDSLPDFLRMHTDVDPYGVKQVINLEPTEGQS